MCGIAGLIRPGGAGCDLGAAVAAMTTALAHRGPDDAGIWTDPAAGVALGHRRLAIIDLSAAGRQPMVSASGRYVLSYNGEIYNFRELRRDLENGGVRCRGTGDTEVLLAAIESWGLERALARAAGMFAFALFDRVARRLVLARDRLGIKPLYWSFENGMLAFASELAPLAARPDWTPRIDRGALAAYVRWNYVPAPHAIFEGVRKLRPGHVLSLDRRGRLEERAFWRLVDVVGAGAPARSARPDEPEAVAGLATVLGGTIRQHMVADVPLGVLLSGGIDSSAILALMRAQTGRRIDTFTIGYDDPAFDEAPRARAVARHFGTMHHELHVGAAEAASAVARLPATYDEPFADSSQIPSVLIARFARRRVAVCLAGDGGDELLAGYERYHRAAATLRWLGWLPMPARRTLARAVRALPAAAWQAALAWDADGRRGGSRTGDRVDKLARLLSEDGEQALYRGLHGHWPGARDLVIAGAEPEALAWQDAWSLPAGFVERQQLADLLMYVPDDLLTKLDRASMAVGLEVRVPLLDHRVVEYCWRLPHALKYRAGVTKYLLRRLLEQHLPRAVIRQPKRGFRAPIAAWLRTSLRDWAEDLLAEERLRRDGLLDAAAVRATWQAFLGGHDGLQEALWGILMLQAWQRAFAERAAGAGAAARFGPPPPERLAG